MSWFTGIANAGLSAISPQYNNIKKHIDTMGENAEMRGQAAIVLSVALAVLSIAFIFGGSTAGALFLLFLSGSAMWLGLNNMKMGENIKEVAINPLNYLDERTCFAKLSEGTIMFDFMTRKFTRIILHGQ